MNVYHRNDVVAYRIEPLLMPKGETPAHPAYVPFFGGGADGQRLHVKLKETVRHIRVCVCVCVCVCILLKPVQSTTRPTQTTADLVTLRPVLWRGSGQTTPSR